MHPLHTVWNLDGAALQLGDRIWMIAMLVLLL